MQRDVVQPADVPARGGEHVLTAGENLDLNEGWELNGDISFYSTEDGVEIYPPTIPVKLYTHKGASRWGRRELDTAPAYERLGRIAAAAKGYALVAGKCLLALLGLYALVYLIRRYVFGMTELVGSLESVDNPGDQTLKPINLRRIGKRRC